MGAYYFYGNQTQREWFFVDPTLRNITEHALGRGVGSRCFSLLLLKHDPATSTIKPHPRIGSWIGDEVFIAGDDASPNFFRSVQHEWTDIGPEMIDALSLVDPYSFFDHGGEAWLIDVADSGDIAEPVRRRLLKMFRSSRTRLGTDQYDALIEALRPKD